MLRFLAIGLLLISCAVSAQQFQVEGGSNLVFQDDGGGVKIMLPLDQGSVKFASVVSMAEKQFGLTKDQLFSDYELALMMAFYAKRTSKKRVYIAIGVILFPPLLPAGLSQAGAAKSMKDQIAIYLASLPR